MAAPQAGPLKPHHSNFDERSLQFPQFDKPVIKGCFSVDGDRKVHLEDRRFLNFVRMSPTDQSVRFDLNAGMSNVIRKPEHASEEKIEHILRHIASQLVAGQTHLSADVVCFRGLLRLLMCTPYEQRSGWSILAQRYRNTIYLCRLETPAELAERKRNERTPQTQRMFSYGFKFEQYLVTRDCQGKPDTRQPVNEAEEFCCMFATRLGGCRLLYGAEMDGCAGDQPGGAAIDLDTVDMNALQWAEMKVHRSPQNERQGEQFYRNKSRNWWAQSFLTGVERIVVGERHDSGVVHQTYEWNTHELARNCQRYWSPSVCMEFARRFLVLVRNTLAGVDSAERVWRFDFAPGSPDSEVQAAEVLADDERQRLRFLSEWYVRQFEANCAVKEGQP